MSVQSKQLSFVADEETLELIEKLKGELKVKTSTAVFRKALALANVAADQARGSDGVVTFRGKGSDDEVSIALRA